MTVWLDAQISPRFARWLSETFSVTAQPLRDLGLRDAEDEPIFLAAKKSDALSTLVSLTKTGMLVAQQIQELVAYITDNGFLSGGANPIADGDCIGDNSHLDAALVNSAVTALGSMTRRTPLS